jgi:cytochrome c553
VSRILTSALLTLLLAPAAAQNPPAQTPPAPAPLVFPEGLPDWAFNVPDPVQPPAQPIAGVVRVPGSAREYDAAAIAGNSNPPDWFPAEHPPAPRVVAGPTPNACGSCHLMSGQGHPESADIAHLSVEYFLRQMRDFKSGARREVNRMEPIARALSDEDARLAAEYYAALEPAPFVDVIETATPPKTYVSVTARHRVLSPEGGTEPMGRRIVQIPKDPFRTNIRDPKSGFIAYVPPGSLRRGEELVSTGGGVTTPCAQCHGEALTGAGDVPRIAGMQPVYLARQLIGMRSGSSAGEGSAPMKPAVANLSDDDVIAISAYVGSLPPR